jgi:hypothetical protein
MSFGRLCLSCRLLGVGKEGRVWEENGPQADASDGKATA